MASVEVTGALGQGTDRACRSGGPCRCQDEGPLSEGAGQANPAVCLEQGWDGVGDTPGARRGVHRAEADFALPGWLRAWPALSLGACVEDSEGGDLELVEGGGILLFSLRRPSSSRKPAASRRGAPGRRAHGHACQLGLDHHPGCPVPGIKGSPVLPRTWLSSPRGCPGRSPGTLSSSRSAARKQQG